MAPPLLTATPALLHEYVKPVPVAPTLKVCVPLPEQVAAGAKGWELIAGRAFTVTATVPELVQPAALVAITLYVLLTKGVTATGF